MDPTNETTKDSPTSQATPTNNDVVLDDLDVKLSEVEHSLSERDISARTRAEEELAAELANGVNQDISLDLPDNPNATWPVAATPNKEIVINATPPTKQEEVAQQQNKETSEPSSAATPFAYRGSVTPLEQRGVKEVSISAVAESAPKQSALANAKSALLAGGNAVRDFSASKPPVEAPASIRAPQTAPQPLPTSVNSEISTSPVTPTAPKLAPTIPSVSEATQGNIVPPQTPEQPTPQATQSDDSVRPIRTFRDDIARVLQKKKTTLVDAVVAEENRANRTKEVEAPKEAPRSIVSYIVVFLSGLLITGGLSAYAIYYFFGPTDITRIDVAEVPSIIFVEEQKEFEFFDDESKRDIFRRIGVEKDSALLRLGNIEQLYFTRSIYDESIASTKKMLVSSAEFIARSEFRIDSSFARNLLPEMTFGYHSFDGTQPFIVFKTEFYEDAFAAMLDWEPRMNEDLSPLFGDIVMETYLVGSSTRTRPANLTFEDVLVKNKEVRVLHDANGKELLLYGFPNPETLIITTNQYTFTEIVTRLQSIRI